MSQEISGVGRWKPRALQAELAPFPLALALALALASP